MSMREGKRTLREVEERVRGFFVSKKRMPSYAEMVELLVLKSKNAVSQWVAKLGEAGVVSQDRTGRLSAGNIFNQVRVLGVIEAGFPNAAEEEVLDTMNLDSYLIGNRSATYVLRVKGDSMRDAGIREGDLAIVERGVEPKVGDIVIAEVDGAWTMKYYRKRGGVAVLEAANTRYKIIIPKEDLKIEAVVRSIIRKYQ